MVLTIRTTLWSSYRKIVTWRHYDQKDCRFAKFCRSPLNHRFDLVIWCLLSDWHFGAVSVKFSLNLITKQKMANLQNTGRRLIIMLLSLFFLLIIRASIWSPYCKNLAKLSYDQKDDQFANYCHTPLNLRFHLVFWCLSSNRHFATLTIKFLLNPITKEAMTNLQNTFKCLRIIFFKKCFAADHPSKVLELLLWNSCRTPLWNKIWPICETLSQAFYSPFLRWSISAYHVGNILEFLLWNFHLTKLRLIRWPV